MDCSKSIELMSDLHEDALDETLKSDVQTHLTDCVICSGVYGDLEVIVQFSHVLRDDAAATHYPDEQQVWLRITREAN